jgi:hypothetical protein
VILILRPELAPLLVQPLDVRLQRGQRERVERQYVLSVLGLAVRLDHPAVHRDAGDLDQGGACGAADPASAPGSPLGWPA